jgi:hypothetical protein
MHSQITVVGLTLLTSVMGPILVGFTVYHLWLVACNTTTNETFKWKSIEYAVEYYQDLRVKVRAACVCARRAVHPRGGEGARGRGEGVRGGRGARGIWSWWATRTVWPAFVRCPCCARASPAPANYG